MNLHMINYTLLEKKLDEHFPSLPPIVVEAVLECVREAEKADTEIQVKHPTHYNSHPSGVECIQVTSQLDFCLGNTVKYLWRAGLKDGQAEEKDLMKAQQYLDLRKKYYSNEELSLEDAKKYMDQLIESVKEGT